MSDIIQYIINIPVNYISVVLLVFFYTLEHFKSSTSTSVNRFDHLFNNVLMHIAVVVVSYFVALAQVKCIEWTNIHKIGLFIYLEVPLWIKVILGVIALDLCLYWSHRVSHISPLLWRLHRVHHSDTNMDASSSFRNHPLEVIVTATFTVTGSALLGIDTTVLSVYIFVLIPAMFLQHTSVNLPTWLERSLEKIIVTPNLHKVHHAQEQALTDSNFADLFVFWDKLFGTFRPLPVEGVVCGLEEFDEEKKQTFWYLMKSPFIKMSK